jgi:hypothetical protein
MSEKILSKAAEELEVRVKRHLEQKIVDQSDPFNQFLMVVDEEPGKEEQIG